MRERGFTLLELLIVMGILGVLAAVAVPGLRRVSDGLQLDYEAARLASEVRYYREIIGTFQPQHEEFLSVQGEPTPTFVFYNRGYHLRTSTKISRRHTLAEGINLTANRRELKFSVNGGGKPMSFLLQKGSDKRYIIIDVAGRVRVSRTPPLT